jgi:hypothetical protein
MRGKIREGARNHTLTRLTGILIQKGVDPRLVHEIIQSLNKTHCDPAPLPESEVTGIVESICRRELQKIEEVNAFIFATKETSSWMK